MDFSKFDKEFDVEDLAKEVEEASEGGGDYEEVPFGTYEVAVNKMECTVTKKEPARPMLSIWFKIVSGDKKGQIIFFNKLLNMGFLLHQANEMLRSLVDGDMEIKFESFAQYEDLILDVDEFIADKFEYELEYGEDSKGYNTYSINQVFDVE